jgi:hypothetical protein
MYSLVINNFKVAQLQGKQLDLRKDFTPLVTSYPDYGLNEDFVN